MKNKLKKAVTAAGVLFIGVGLILCVIGANNGGSFMRAMEHSGINMKFNAGTDNNGNYYPQYGSGDYYGDNYGGSNPADDQMRDFFRQFGMSDDDIDMFLDPFGSRSGGGNSGGYPIQ